MQIFLGNVRVFVMLLGPKDQEENKITGKGKALV